MNEIKLKITIDGKEAAASVQLTDKEIQALSRSIRDADKAAKNTNENIISGFSQARNVIQGFKETWSVLSTAMGSLVIAYGEQELGERKLQTALQQTGNYTQAVMQEFKNYASQLQQTTLYGDELYLNLFAQLQAMGLTVDQTKQAAIQAANLATVMGTDLSSAARVFGDLLNGNATLINRYIKGLDETILKSGDTSKILEHLNQRIGNQATEAAKTGAGAITQFNNVLSDARENAGMLLSKGLNPFVTGLRDIIVWLNKTHPAISGAVVAIGSLTAVLITLRVTGITAAASAIYQTLIPAIVTLSQTMIAFALSNPFTAALLAVGALAAGIGALVLMRKSDLEVMSEKNSTDIKDQQIQQQKIENNIQQAKTENDLIDKTKKLHDSINQLKEGTSQRVQKEKELHNALVDLEKLHPGVINSNNSFKENLKTLNEIRQSNIDKEKEYQTELTNTIKKLDELQNKKWFIDFGKKVDEATGSSEGLFGFDTKLTEAFKKAAYTGNIDKRITELETLKNKSNEELFQLYGARTLDINEFKNDANKVLEVLYEKKKEVLSTLTTPAGGKTGKKDIEDRIAQQKKLYDQLVIGSKNGREKEIAQLQLKYKEQKSIAAGNQKILTMLENQFNSDLQAINIKWDKQQLEDETKFWADIKKIREKEEQDRKERLNKLFVGPVTRSDKPPIIGVTDKTTEEIAHTNFQMGLLYDLTTSVEEGFLSAGSAVASAMGQAVQVFSQANSLLQIFINSLIQAIVQTLALKAAQAALNFITGGIGGFFSMLFGGGGGASAAAADGAVVTQPTFMMVGEGKEPEGVFPLSYLNNLLLQPRTLPVQTQKIEVKLQPAELTASGMDMRAVLKQVESDIKARR